jgi:hypothetical protein
MTKEERAVERALAIRERAAKRNELRLKEARAVLAAKCTHPMSARRTYRWEHDNGYGQQHWRIGLMCALCLARCPYPRSEPGMGGLPDEKQTFIAPEDIEPGM